MIFTQGINISSNVTSQSPTLITDVSLGGGGNGWVYWGCGGAEYCGSGGVEFDDVPGWVWFVGVVFSPQIEQNWFWLSLPQFGHLFI